jgi:hypothetical protein
MGSGTTANPNNSSTADAKFIEFICKSTASSGDNRLMYLRYDIDGAGGGECIRAFTELGASCGTARGAHISLEVNSADYPTGLGVGVDAQLMLESGATGGGTLAALQAEVYGASGATVGSSSASFLRFSNNGASSTETDDIDDNADLMALNGFTVGAGNILQADTDETKFSHKARIDIGGTKYYIMLTNS